MNFTLTPGVYAALNLLSKSARSKVLEAAFAFVICGIRPTDLSKNLLVMFMMVVDSASEGKLTYIPDQPAEEKVNDSASEEQEQQEPQPQPAPEHTHAPQEEKPVQKLDFQLSGGNRQPSDSGMSALAGVKKTHVGRRRKRNRKANA